MGCVPIPKINEPWTFVEPLPKTGGNEITDPLLSLGNRVTGFVTCVLMAARIAPHPELGQL